MYPKKGKLCIYGVFPCSTNNAVKDVNIFHMRLVATDTLLFYSSR